MTKIKLTIDSSVKDETGRAKLADLHTVVVEKVMHLGISDYVKVTIEYNSACQDQDLNKQSAEEPLPLHEEALATVLSSRQQQIAVMLCEHFSIKRIAAELYVSENTVKKHIQNMKKALETDKTGADFIYLLKELLRTGKIHEDHTLIG